MKPGVPTFLRSVYRTEYLSDMAWIVLARCTETDPEAFFPERGDPGNEAKRVCRSCEVRAECLDYALRHGIRFGTWGGTSESDRRRMRRELRAAESERAA